VLSIDPAFDHTPHQIRGSEALSTLQLDNRAIVEAQKKTTHECGVHGPCGVAREDNPSPKFKTNLSTTGSSRSNKSSLITSLTFPRGCAVPEMV
jgi:hypothetical protein